MKQHHSNISVIEVVSEILQIIELVIAHSSLFSACKALYIGETNLLSRLASKHHQLRYFRLDGDDIVILDGSWQRF